MKRKLLVLISAVILICSSVGAQNIYFDYSDGTNSTYSIEEIRKITFTNDVMNLHLYDGTTYSWDVNLIDQYQYELSPLQIDAILKEVNSMEVNVHPNPADDNLQVSFTNIDTKCLCLSIFDLQGRILFEENCNSFDLGKTNYTIELSTFQSGQYFVRLTGQNTSITKKFIKK
jgi:hypothetical protein